MNIIERAISAVSPSWAMQRAAAREILASYSGAVPTRMEKPWPMSMGNPVINNSLTYGNALRSLRDRARELVENNAIAAGMLDRVVDNVIGSGMTLQVTSSDADWNKRAEALFAGWYDTADVTGNTWLENQRLACYGWLRDGDIGDILLQDGRIQPIEGDYIATPNTEMVLPGSRIIDGVELNEQNRPVRYWINTWKDEQITSTPIDASNFIFLARRKQHSKLRGEPCFAPVFQVFDQLDQWQKAVLMNAKLAAYFAVFVKKGTPSLAKLATKVTGADGATKRELKFEPGTITELRPGEEIGTVESKQPGQNFPENFALNVRTLGLVLGLPLEFVLLDWSRVNGQTARATLIQTYRSFRSMQSIYIGRRLSRIYRWRVSKWIKEGKLAEIPDAWNHRWIPQPWPFLDPVKEIQALQMGIDAGIETIAGALLAQGRDFETWIGQRGEELARMKAEGITPLHSAAFQTFGPDAVSPSTPDGTGGELVPDGEGGQIEE